MALQHAPTTSVIATDTNGHPASAGVDAAGLNVLTQEMAAGSIAGTGIMKIQQVGAPALPATSRKISAGGTTVVGLTLVTHVAPASHLGEVLYQAPAANTNSIWLLKVGGTAVGDGGVELPPGSAFSVFGGDPYDQLAISASAGQTLNWSVVS